MGESPRDRCALLAQLGRLDPHPESLPVNVLVRTPGTPLADAEEIDPIELVRTIACARLVAPKARVRLSAGRLALVGRSAGALLRRRRQLDLFRREAADLAQSDGRRRSAVDGSAGSAIPGMTRPAGIRGPLCGDLSELRARAFCGRCACRTGIDLVSNDYLGLAGAPGAVRCHARRARRPSGWLGRLAALARASRNFRARRRHGSRVFADTDRHCCSVPGYAANIGLLQAIVCTGRSASFQTNAITRA